MKLAIWLTWMIGFCISMGIMLADLSDDPPPGQAGAALIVFAALWPALIFILIGWGVREKMLSRKPPKEGGAS